MKKESLKKITKELKEIKYPVLEREKSNTSERCPKCGSKMRYDTIPCPEGMPGCLVKHYGYICLECGSIFQYLKLK